jgi:hypothetical protein
MPIVAPQSLRGGGERRGRKAGLRRKRRVSPLVAATGGGRQQNAPTRQCTTQWDGEQGGPERPVGIRAIKLERGRLGVTTGVRYISIDESGISWKRGARDKADSRSVPFTAVDNISIGRAVSFGRQFHPWNSVCLSARVGKGRATRLRSFYFSVPDAREARQVIMDVQHGVFGRESAPLSHGQLLWETARMRCAHRAKCNNTTVLEALRSLWRDARVARSARNDARTRTANCVAAAGIPVGYMGSRLALQSSPLGAFYPSAQPLRPKTAPAPTTRRAGPMAADPVQRRRLHRQSEPAVLRPRTAGAITASRRNSVGDVPPSDRPRTPDRIARGNARRSPSPQKRPASSGGSRPETMEVGGIPYFSPEEAAWINGSGNSSRPHTAGAMVTRKSSLQNHFCEEEVPVAAAASQAQQRPRTAATQRPRTAFRQRPATAAGTLVVSTGGQWANGLTITPAGAQCPTCRCWSCRCEQTQGLY